jgi:hypothetical protein
MADKKFKCLDLEYLCLRPDFNEIGKKAKININAETEIRKKLF